MTVAELLEELMQHDDDTVVFIELDSVVRTIKEVDTLADGEIAIRVDKDPFHENMEGPQ